MACFKTKRYRSVSRERKVQKTTLCFKLEFANFFKASSHGQFNDCGLTKLAGNELAEKLFLRENAKYAVS